MEGAEARGLELSEASEFDAVPGQGLVGTVDGRQLLIGNARLLEGHNVSTDGLLEPAADLAAGGKTAMLVAIDNRPAGVVAAADQIKPSAQAAIAGLKELGLEVAMISGDNKRTAEAVATRLSPGWKASPRAWYSLPTRPTTSSASKPRARRWRW